MEKGAHVKVSNISGISSSKVGNYAIVAGIYAVWAPIARRDISVNGGVIVYASKPLCTTIKLVDRFT
jgi:hypothetical protein